MPESERPGIIVKTKFVRPGSKIFSTYIKYIDREEAIKGGTVRGDYSAYEEIYMGNPEKTTGLFTQEEDRLTPETAEDYKKSFQKAQDQNSLLWQTVISFDNDWLAQLQAYDPETGILDESRIKEMTRQFMGTLLKREKLEEAVWTAAIHYNTDNIHVHIAIVDPEGQREKVAEGKYAGEPKGTWNLRSIRYANQQRSIV